MRFADYLGRAFSSVGAAQFPWVKIFKESPVAKLVDVRILFYNPSMADAMRVSVCMCCSVLQQNTFFSKHTHVVTKF